MDQILLQSYQKKRYQRDYDFFKVFVSKFSISSNQCTESRKSGYELMKYLNNIRMLSFDFNIIMHS